MNEITKNAQAVEKKVTQQLLSVGQQRLDLEIIVVTKSVSGEETEEIARLGYRHLAENRPEGLKEKQKLLSGYPITWHYIGSLQRRKVKQVVNSIDYLHSLDRLSLAEEIEKRAEKEIKCFLQINITGEETKSGLKPEEISSFLNDIASFQKIKVVGLMTMAPKDANEKTVRHAFHMLKQLRDETREKSIPNAPCTELSMGMSQDYLIAIEEGATFVRIGSAFFTNY
ncbi:MAG: YggS family pyridoxal phosphate-dependent enzyme [Pisciglobus halotolerans]|nr:YggS family pyridoxal phosphate-dependent enzyme [Pisciglobus halotolerans]